MKHEIKENSSSYNTKDGMVCSEPECEINNDRVRRLLCNKEIKEEDFKDVFSRKEYRISGICQSCQDKIFL